MSILISHSDIASFLRCRRQFGWGYIDDRKAPDRQWGPLACGNRVHMSIETFHKLGEDPLAVHHRLAVAAEAQMVKDGAPSWALGELYDDVVFGRNCIIAYLDWIEKEGVYHGYIVQSEVHLEAPILGGRATLRGKADLLLTREDDGWMFIDDLKTSSSHVRTTLPVLLERSYQHWVYMVLVSLLHPEAIVGGAHYTVLYKVKVPARATHPMVERIPTRATMSQAPNKLAQIENIVRDMLELMERRDEFGSNVAYPTPGDSCRWCPFKHPCLLADENPLGARAMLDLEFQRGGRHARYDDA